MCDCNQLLEIVNCGDDEQEQFVRPKKLRFLREKPGARLYSCPECGIFWHVDHMERGPQAIKVAEPFRWESFDDKPYRLMFMERYHGGSSTDVCMWRGCNSFALKGMAFCVRHAYPELTNGPR